MKIVTKQITDLVPHPANYRVHPPEQLAALIDSLKFHHQPKPVVITADNVILAGHGLVEAAKLAGITELSCSIYEGEQPLAYIAMDNKSASMAVDDNSKLAALLQELDNGVQEMAATGFSNNEITQLLSALDENSISARASDVVQKIASEQEIRLAQKTAGALIEKITKRVNELAENDPTLLNKALAIAIPTERGHECLIFTDKATPDIIAELRRLLADGATSPLTEIFAAINPL